MLIQILDAVTVVAIIGVLWTALTCVLREWRGGNER